MFDIVNGCSDCEALTSMLPLHAPARTFREMDLLIVPNDGHRSFFNPFYECCKCFNSVTDKFDYGMSKFSFKNRIRGLG